MWRRRCGGDGLRGVEERETAVESMYVKRTQKRKKNVKGDKDKLILWYWWMYEIMKANIEATY